MSRVPTPLRGRQAIVAAADPALVQRVTDVLRAADLRVYRAYDAQATYELAVQLGVDIVVTNSCIGTIDGDILVHALRRRLPHLPILHISGGGAQDRLVEARIPEDIPSLELPFSDQELVQAVAAVLP